MLGKVRVKECLTEAINKRKASMKIRRNPQLRLLLMIQRFDKDLISKNCDWLYINEFYHFLCTSISLYRGWREGCCHRDDHQDHGNRPSPVCGGFSRFWILFQGSGRKHSNDQGNFFYSAYICLFLTTLYLSKNILS